MIRDIEYYIAKLGKIDGFGDSGEYLMNIVQSKQIEPPEPPAPAVPEKDTKETTPEAAKPSDDGVAEEAEA
jgi:vacuolar protein sorting-associated protein 54